MARPLRIEYSGAFYHITACGNERKPLYKSKQDRERFLSYLESATDRYGAVVHVYCLMDNHFHLFLETPRGNLSQIMHHINGAYTTYFNTKRERSGHLFQGRYKAILVDVDEYAEELSHSIFLGGEGFVAEIKSKCLVDKEEDRDLPILKALSKRADFNDIETIVDLYFKSDEKLARQVKLHICHRFSGKKLRDIGKRFGISESGVTQASQRIKIKAEKEKSIKRKIKSIEKKLVLSNV